MPVLLYEEFDGIHVSIHADQTTTFLQSTQFINSSRFGEKRI